MQSRGRKIKAVFVSAYTDNIDKQVSTMYNDLVKQYEKLNLKIESTSLSVFDDKAYALITYSYDTPQTVP